MGYDSRLREEWTDQVEAIDKWMAIFSANPEGLALPATVEVSGEVYARQQSLWTRTGPTVLTLAESVRWRNLPPGSVVAAVGGFDDPFDGLLVFSELVLPEPVSYPSGGTYTLPAGEYELRID